MVWSYDFVEDRTEDPQHAFPGHGQMKPEQLEIVRLKREVAKLKAERDILKLREGIDVKFSFIAKHRGIWAGIGASHQTGWTALVANLIDEWR
jgi:hypothetical protein